MADFVEKTLEAWDLSEYIDKFKDEKIDEQVFLHMPESMIKEIIPTIGKRFHFLKNREALVKSANESFVLESSNLQTSDSDVSIVSNTSMNSLDRGINLRTLLSESSCGRKILSQMRLTPSDRSKLCYLIIDKLLCKCKRISSHEFQEWSAEIVSVFKHEKASTYYVPSNAKFKRLANGKLWDKYNNLKKYIKQNEKENIREKENVEYPKFPDSEETLLKLRTIQPDDPNIITLWRETFETRNKEISIENYYEEYPILKTSIGAILLQIDFEIETGIDAHVFPRNWSKLAAHILEFATKREVCPSLCDMQNDIHLETLSFFILPYLFQPCHVKTGNKKKWKPSKTEIAESFICRIPNIAELEPKLNKRKEKLHTFGLTLQPMVVAVGPIVSLTDFYVIINNNKYVSTSLMSAIDLCFQAFFALNAKYPVDSEMVWNFLQYYVYGLTSAKYIRHFVSVDSVGQSIEELIAASQE